MTVIVTILNDLKCQRVTKMVTIKRGQNHDHNQNRSIVNGQPTVLLRPPSTVIFGGLFIWISRDKPIRNQYFDDVKDLIIMA